MTRNTQSLLNEKPTISVVPGQTTLANGTITGAVRGADPDGDVLRYTASRPKNGGTVAINSNGTYVYTPGAQFATAGSDTFSVTVRDRPPATGLMGLLFKRGAMATTTVSVVHPTTTTPNPPAVIPSAAAVYKWGTPVAALSDDFNGSGAPPQSAWGLYNSPGHAGNGLRRPGQVTEQGGYLQIAGLSNGTSGGMMSLGVNPAYGRWEVRMRVDQQGSGNPYHAVVALIPSGVPYNNGSGDLDFAEADADADGVFAFIHHSTNKQTYASVSLDLSTWHTYSIEVAPDHISWFVDGKVTMTTTNRAAITGAKWTTNVQLDAFTPSGLAPADLQVDYFRYYTLPTSGAPIIPGPPGSIGDYR